MLDYLLRYISSKNGKKLVLGTTVIDQLLFYCSISSMFEKPIIRDMTLGKFWKLEATNLLLAMLHIDETPVKVGI